MKMSWLLIGKNPLKRAFAAASTSWLRRIGTAYLGVGVLLSLIKFSSLIAWMVAKGTDHPDVPWYSRVVGEHAIIVSESASVVATFVGWPYYLYVLLAHGESAFFESMFYIWN